MVEQGRTKRSVLVLLSMGVAMLTPIVGRAQLSAGSAPSSLPPPEGVAPIRWPAVAYSPDDDVYLAVSGAGHIGGWWLSGDGAPIDVPFTIGGGAAATFAQGPRVAYAEGAFVVTWHETIPGDAVRVRARLVPHGAPLGADFDVSPVGTNWEMGATPAWSPASHELLVAWQSFADTRIYAQRVSATGALLGGPIAIDPRPIYFRDPAVAYHAATDTFFVAYAGCVADGDCFVDVQRVQAGTGALVGGPIVLDSSIRAGYVPEIAYDAATEDVLVVWDRVQPSDGGFFSRTIDRDGTPSAAPMLVTNTLGAYDANALAWDALSGSFLFVTHGATEQDAALELSAAGLPIGAAVPFGVTSIGGNFNPRVASRGSRGEWLAVTSSDFATLTAQRFETTTRVPVTDVDAAIAPDAALDRDGATADAALIDASVSADGGRSRGTAMGCGCHAGARGASADVLALGLAYLALRGARRRAV
jgi:hypothetical protein